jgi:hypothetical protein
MKFFFVVDSTCHDRDMMSNRSGDRISPLRNDVAATGHGQLGADTGTVSSGPIDRIRHTPSTDSRCSSSRPSAGHALAPISAPEWIRRHPPFTFTPQTNSLSLQWRTIICSRPIGRQGDHE